MVAFASTDASLLDESTDDLELRLGSKGSVATSASTTADSERLDRTPARPRSANGRSRPPKLRQGIQVSKLPPLSPTSSQSTPRNLDLEVPPRPVSSNSNYLGSRPSSRASSLAPTTVSGGVGNRNWAAWQSCNIHKDLAFERNLDLCFDPQQSPSYQPSSHPDVPVLPPGVEPLKHGNIEGFNRGSGSSNSSSSSSRSSGSNEEGRGIREKEQLILASETTSVEGKVAPRAPSSQRPLRTGRSSRAWTRNQLSQLRENFNVDMNPDLCFVPLREGRRPPSGLQHFWDVWQGVKN